MTRLYALLTLVALARLAGPPLGHAAVYGLDVANRSATQVAHRIAEGWMHGEDVEEIGYDVVGCIVTDIEEGRIR